MHQPQQKKKPKEDLSERIIFGIAKIYKWWSRIILMNEDDPFLITVLKILFRLVGIVILVLLSPLAILGLIIGVASVL